MLSSLSNLREFGNKWLSVDYDIDDPSDKALRERARALKIKLLEKTNVIRETTKALQQNAGQKRLRES